MLPCVLVVDDDQAIRETLRLVLDDAGYPVEEAPDGETALVLLRETDQRMVVLLDLIMPGMNGEQLLAIVADEPRLVSRHSYVLMTAAHKRLTLSVQKRLDALDAPIMQKPFDLDTLLTVVADASQRLGD